MSDQGTSFKSSIHRFAAATALAIVSALAMGSAADAAPWSKPIDATRKGERMGDSVAAVGNNGYAVIAWTGYHPCISGCGDVDAPQARVYSKARMTLKVKKPGAIKFGKRLKLPGIGDYAPQVDIAANGQTVLIWRQAKTENLMASFRTPRTGWTKPQVVAPDFDNYPRLSVGPDGTATIFTVDNYDSASTKKVLVSVRKPSGRFGKFRQVNPTSQEVGAYTDVAAGTRGQATVAWSGSCRSKGPSKPTEVVDISQTGEISPPEVIRNSKCMGFGLDIETDRAGNDLLMFAGGSTYADNRGFRVTTRREGGKFKPAAYGRGVDGQRGEARLDMSPDGHFTIFWPKPIKGTGRSTMNHYVTGTTRTGQRRSRVIEGIKDGDHLIDFATRRNGSVSTVWQDLFTITTIETGVLSPAGDFSGLKFLAESEDDSSLQYGGIEVAPDGSEFAWWQPTHRTGWDAGFFWTSR